MTPAEVREMFEIVKSHREEAVVETVARFSELARQFDDKCLDESFEDFGRAWREAADKLQNLCEVILRDIK